VKAALVAVAVNIAFKFALMGPLQQVGLALATSIGAWINFLLVVWFARRAGFAGIDDRLRQSVPKLAAAGVVLAVALYLAVTPVMNLGIGGLLWRDEVALAVLIVIGALVYGGTLLALFGTRWLRRIHQKDQ